MKTKLFTLLISVFISFCSYGQEKIIKILAIGNSFSEDALENYLYDLAKADGNKIIIGNLYIGGAPISLHVKNGVENKNAYSYRKVNELGVKTTQKETSIETALKDEKWDYISLQQSSPLSGQYDVIMKDLLSLISYVRQHISKDAKLVYHQTWAYQKDSSHKGFANYNNDQNIMYNAIAAVSKKIAKQKDFNFVVPAGTAIQNARTSFGDKLTRDGYHLQLTYGRFTAACTWYEKLFGKDVTKNSFYPSTISEEESKTAKKAAHKAFKKPYKISTL